MAKSLIIVESAAKTKTIGGFLGPDFELAASFGHVRDLPPKQMSVDVDHGFTPTYTVMADKAEVVRKLKKAAASAERVYLATDPDREGEAIAWHLYEALGLKNVLRIEFNEITRSAVERALEHPRELAMDRVNAQQARRVLDRLVGYKLSPLLWRKVKNARSAGRVQSVAVRLIVEREREIRAFVPVEHWKITARLFPEGRADEVFEARMERIAGAKWEVGAIPDEAAAQALVEELRDASWQVVSTGTRKAQRQAQPPLITSTLQRDASTKLGFSAKRTMNVAQRLYEGLPLGGGDPVGLITYMRTDSTRVADEAREAAMGYISATWGDAYVGKGSRGRAVRGAQEAHECIRPSYIERHPDEIDRLLPGREHSDERKLYRLIWTRFMASQMAPAQLETSTVDIGAGSHLFRASGTQVLFPGYMALTGLPGQKAKAATTEESSDDDDDDDVGRNLPQLAKGDDCGLKELTPTQHFTQPPPRYSEATLVKTLEERGIGRPSTYAPILSTIVERRYVKLDARRFVPTPLGEAVTDSLVKHFPLIMDVDFTAKFERDLDDVESGEADWVALLGDFYTPFDAAIKEAYEGMERVRVEAVETEHECPKCGAKMLERQGRFGTFLGCSRYPECDGLMNLDRQGKPVQRAAAQKTEIPCAECSKPMVLRTSRRGPFLGCSGYPKCRKTMAMTPELQAQLEAAGLTMPPMPKPKGQAEDEGETEG
ncbi:MAG: type I DNA topoisomerase [Armatimonadetes bacterium]|nr:type I DNA topoisomerase [Armatimonadota bacterium]